mgnify:CR=1 FL=1
MCGIVAYLGNQESYSHLIHGLKMLQNRGYDSAGICVINNQGFYVMEKYASTDKITAIEKLENFASMFNNSNIGIAHERWSTTGPKTNENSHPHIDNFNKFAIVHNGIIENYEELKEELIENHGIVFLSQTDTEVIVNLIAIYYNKLRNVEMSIRMAIDKLRGTWGLVILHLSNPNKLYCLRHGSPILIGFNESNTSAFIASEQSAFCKFAKNYISLKDHDLVVLEKKNENVQFTKNNNYISRNIMSDEFSSFSTNNLGDFKHWTIKEIYEQPASILRALGNGGRIINSSSVKLGGLSNFITEFKPIENLIILGCGTSYHAGLYGSYLIKKISGFNTVTVMDGADFNVLDIPKVGDTVVIFLSQSGETKDLHRALEIANSNYLSTIGIVNVVDSLIAREVMCGVYLNAGKEVGVASTKVFMSHVVVLSLIAVWFAQIRDINENERKMVISDLKKLYLDVKTIIDNIHSQIKNIATSLINTNNMFILGKANCEAIAKEGSLKIKEISYVHSESYSTSSLKHGPFALITKDMYLIVINLDNEDMGRNNSVIDEIKCREGNIIVITDKFNYNKSEIVIKIPINQNFSSLLSVVPLQLLAYEMSITRGINPDFPRNLAKTLSTD